MIALDSGDKIRGDASAATVVDYTIHGLDNNSIKQLADGQLADAIGIYLLRTRLMWLLLLY